MSKVVVVMTCFNRKDKTVNCLKKLHEGNGANHYSYIVVDDRSKDGTVEAITELGYSDVNIVEGTGSLFWNGGMHMGIDVAFKTEPDFNYMLLVNDDVDFIPGCIDELVEYSKSLNKDGKECVVVGATKDDKGRFSYGGIKYTSGIKYEMLGPDKSDISCDTFNANCTLIPYEVMKKAGNVDPFYKHSMGDFDLGLRIRKDGTRIYVYHAYIGVCNDNPIDGTWQDPKLPVGKRFKLKESFKGLPFKDWFHYLNKNFGFITACLRSVTPYIKILLHK